MVTPKYDYALMVELAESGLSSPQIAERLGCSKTTAARATQGIRINKSLPPTADVLERARLFLEDGASYTEAGRTVGVNGTTLKRHLPGYGWPDYLAGKLREELKYIAQHAVANRVEVTALSKLSKTN